MDDDSHVIDKGWDALPDYAKAGDADEAVTVSISTTPGEWLVNTMDSVVVPMSMADVVDALRAHKLTARSLVWRAGMPEWAPIDKVPPLKLAARMPATLAAGPSAPPPKAAGTAPPPSSASLGHPASKSPPARPTPAPQAQLSRRSTLPFGLPIPAAAGSRPSQPKPLEPPPPPSEEPEVLAVYARPAATISFDLSPSEPARVPSPPPVLPPPQTLAPTTSDTHRPPRSPPPHSADLSVVAASQFRAVQRTSKRLVWVSSVGSAAAASLLTLWLSGVAPWSRPAPAKARAPEAGVAVAAAAAPAVAAKVAATPPVTPSAAPEPAPRAAPAEVAAAEVATPVVAAPQPAARKARAVAPAPVAARPSELARSAPRQPSAEPNPYDVKLDDDAPAGAASKPPARGLLDMMQESEAKASAAKEPEASAASGSNAPGF